VLDLCLPDGLGGAVLKELQGRHGGRPVWVVMSALEEDEAARQFGPLRGPFLAKPFDPCRLVDTLSGLLSDTSAAPRRMKAEPPPPARRQRKSA
jgi:DNA-binding NtrC family response regulator